jgi:hypothetical protein
MLSGRKTASFVCSSRWREKHLIYLHRFIVESGLYCQWFIWVLVCSWNKLLFYPIPINFCFITASGMTWDSALCNYQQNTGAFEPYILSFVSHLGQAHLIQLRFKMKDANMRQAQVSIYSDISWLYLTMPIFDFGLLYKGASSEILYNRFTPARASLEVKLLAFVSNFNIMALHLNNFLH